METISNKQSSSKRTALLDATFRSTWSICEKYMCARSCAIAVGLGMVICWSYASVSLINSCVDLSGEAMSEEAIASGCRWIRMLCVTCSLWVAKGLCKASNQYKWLNGWCTLKNDGFPTITRLDGLWTVGSHYVWTPRYDIITGH